jgi:hypothetical protein
MTDFEFLFSVFGLLIGLTFIEIAIKFADAIDAHSRRPIGVLTPLLAFFVMIDVAGFWLFTWSLREMLHVRWRIVFIGLAAAMIYYLSASMIFPRSEGEWKNLDDHYWARKRLVIGGILLVEGTLMAWQWTRAVPALDDYWFWIYQLPYFIPLVGVAVHPVATPRHPAVCRDDRHDAVLRFRSRAELALGARSRDQPH